MGGYWGDSGHYIRLWGGGVGGIQEKKAWRERAGNLPDGLVFDGCAIYLEFIA